MAFFEKKVMTKERMDIKKMGKNTHKKRVWLQLICCVGEFTMMAYALNKCAEKDWTIHRILHFGTDPERGYHGAKIQFATVWVADQTVRAL